MLKFNFQKSTVLLTVTVSTLALTLGACSSSHKKQETRDTEVSSHENENPPRESGNVPAETYESGQIASSNELDALEDRAEVPQEGAMAQAPATGAAPSSTTLDQDLAAVTEQQAGRAARSEAQPPLKRNKKKMNCDCECDKSSSDVSGSQALDSTEQQPGQAEPGQTLMEGEEGVTPNPTVEFDSVEAYENSPSE